MKIKISPVRLKRVESMKRAYFEIPYKEEPREMVLDCVVDFKLTESGRPKYGMYAIETDGCTLYKCRFLGPTFDHHKGIE